MDGFPCGNHYSIALREVLTSVFQELTTYDFVMLLLAMISPHMLTFRLMVTMVAEFCPLVILIHNTLQGSVVYELQGLTKKNSRIGRKEVVEGGSTKENACVVATVKI